MEWWEVLVIISLIGVVGVVIALILKTIQLCKRIDCLDPKHVSQNLAAAIQKLDQFKAALSNELTKTQKDLNTTNDQLAELIRKVKKFISLTREVTKGVVQNIEKRLRNELGGDFFEEKPKEATELASSEGTVEAGHGTGGGGNGPKEEASDG